MGLDRACAAGREFGSFTLPVSVDRALQAGGDRRSLSIRACFSWEGGAGVGIVHAF